MQKGGSKPIELCLSSTVCRLIRFYSQAKDRDLPLMDLLRKQLAPSTGDELFARLKKIEFQWKNDLNCIHKYNSSFLEVYDSAPDTKIYVKVIYIRKLSGPLYDLIDDGVTDIDELDRTLLMIAKRLLDGRHTTQNQ
ncbi:hypothetical protein ADUPG1_008212 [Aduncisulcus paluster]|uniref:Uncharacterized protein n=1 Tax=Aduncisulcus paluster TaxID=2918883 RepID=A0ABQ5KR60_9EUKA|nr:hypothetical protein ADUPG1_008212 [Aduncisulcus paluster]